MITSRMEDKHVPLLPFYLTSRRRLVHVRHLPEEHVAPGCIMRGTQDVERFGRFGQYSAGKPNMHECYPDI